MRPTNLSICSIVVACVVTLAASNAPGAETLADKLGESGWDGIIGTWVDADTKGQAYRVTYAWKIKGWVIESTTKEGKKETVSLMGVNGKTGDVFHVGADSEGTTSLGKWDVDEGGDAVLGLVYTSGDGQEGALSIRFHRLDDDTLMVTIELPQPIKFRIVRVRK